MSGGARVNAGRPAILAALRRTAWLPAAALVAAWHFGSFPWRAHPLVTDVRHFLYFAQQTAGGAWPHLDFFDNKTQLATWLGAGFYRIGIATGVEPLYAIRGGYLALATGAAVLAFAVHRLLGGGAAACGALALSLHGGFFLLGLLPCVGNVPKLAMAALASASALAVHRRAWVAAGWLSAMAAFDWQIGVLAVLGAAAAAALAPAAERGRALARVTLGAALAALPVVAAYAVRGGLGPLWRQTVLASFFRGAATREVSAATGEWARRWQVVASGTEGHTFLLGLAVLGLPAYIAWLRSPRGRQLRAPGAALGIYHFGVLAFSLWDFQVYGDLFALLHTSCFFAALAAGEAYLWVAARLGPARRGIAAALATLACLAIARPWVARGALRVPGGPAAGVTVQTQRDVNAEIAPLLAQPTTAVRSASEQLFLSGKRNPLPFVVWNAAVYSYFRRGTAEDRTATLARLEDAAGITHLVCDHASPRCADRASYRLARTVGDPSRYAVDVYERASPGEVSPRSPAP